MPDIAHMDDIDARGQADEASTTPVAACIAGIGTALPPHNIAQEQAARIAGTLGDYSSDQKKRLEKLYSLTRVANRHSVLLEDDGAGGVAQDFFQPSATGLGDGPSLSTRMIRYERDAPGLALDAAQAALDNARTGPATITHIITVSCSGFVAPGVDAFLIKRLGLPADIERTHVGFMGCHGALNAIRVARSFVESAPEARVLIVAVELCSIHYQYSTSDETNLANGLFSDGAGAMVIARSDSTPGSAWRCAATGSCILPDSEDAMTWRIRDNGFHMTLSRAVPLLIKTHLRSWLTQWLEPHGMDVDTVQTWAVHPGGPAILQGVRDALSLSKEELAASWDVLRDHGNMSSPTILFVLDLLRQRDAPLPCVALGFGPGLAVEATLWRGSE